MQGCFMPSLLEIGPVVLDKKKTVWKVHDEHTNDDNEAGQRTNFNQQSSLEHSAQVSL